MIGHQLATTHLTDRGWRSSFVGTRQTGACTKFGSGISLNCYTAVIPPMLAVLFRKALFLLAAS
jgi:hypothetical protein